MELFLDPNGNDIKLTWRTGQAGSRDKPLLLSKALLQQRGKEIRDDLTRLSKYVGTFGLDPGRDPGWERYIEIVSALRTHGQALHKALLPFNDPRARRLADELAAASPRHADLTIHCSDEQVTLPFGFVFCDRQPRPLARISRPSRADFSGFWVNRHRISMLIAGTLCDSLDIDPNSFRSLYAMDQTEFEDIYDLIGTDSHRLGLLLKNIEFKKAYYSWREAGEACRQIADSNRVVFVFGHSNGDYLKLSGSEQIDSGSFAEILQRDQRETQTTLLILNCCCSVAGEEHCSLLGSVAAPGFCGLVGTEAEMVNTHAIRCGTRLMWGLCARGLSLGKAFDRMQRDEDLFPLNLLYTCYADRRFRLTRPFEGLQLAA
ncbi:hypothetical protein VSR68_15925 [Paraburkholderia phymatum]|uniref:hypothetical protein n=1 Tax=Paraburkholderia phymatum TaxID=148447 RepID=UPI0031822515